MIPGTTMILGGAEYTLAPLSFAQMRDGRAADVLAVQSAIASREVFSLDYMDALTRLAHASITRNHPGVTLEEVSNGLDMGNARDVYMAVLGLSGLSVKKDGASGEPKADGA